jgi:hypothetical protein
VPDTPKTGVERLTGNPMDIEKIGFDLAMAGFFLDLRRVLSNRTTLAGKWECRLQPFGNYVGAWPYAEGQTAKEAIVKAKAKIPNRSNPTIAGDS